MTVAARPSIAPARYEERIEGLRRHAADHALAAVLVGTGPDLRYLTGYPALGGERLTMLIVPVVGTVTLLAPRLEAAPVRSCPAAEAGLVDVVTWEETEDPHTLAADIAGGPVLEGNPPIDVAVSDGLPARHTLRLQQRLSGVTFSLASVVIRPLRMRKDEDELELLRIAAQAADRAIDGITGGKLVGRTEADVAGEVRERLFAEGHDAVSFAVVGSGPNSASPHHEPGERVISPGEPIVFDIGGTIDGYGSDITRTVWVTGGRGGAKPDREFKALYDVLHDAQAKATAAVKPGIPAEEVDRVARDRITEGGYGEHFIHRTGHGIGLEGHEDPYLVAGNMEELDTGMAFSIEPGIYIDGRYGARIEDIVVCGPNGATSLNATTHDLRVVDG